MYDLAFRYECNTLKQYAYQNLEEQVKKPSPGINAGDLVGSMETIELLYDDHPSEYEELRSLFQDAARRHLTKILQKRPSRFLRFLVDSPKWNISFLELLDYELKAVEMPQAAVLNDPRSSRPSGDLQEVQMLG